MLVDIARRNKENVRNDAPLNQSSRRRSQRINASVNLPKSVSTYGRIGSHGQHRPPSAPPQVALPKRLPRPPVAQAIDVADVAAVAPSLAGVPLHYVRDTLRKAGPDLLKAVAGTRPILPKEGGLPSNIQVEMSNVVAARPTHVFAVHPSNPSATSAPGLTKVVLFAAHDLVFAALTSNVKRLPPAASESSGTQLMLPLVPLCIPSPATFPLIQSYLYLREPNLLLKMLLPLPSLPTEPTFHLSARRLAATFTVRALLDQASNVHGLWSNGITLGLDDTEFWSTLDRAWVLIIGALALRTRQRT